MSTRLAIQGAGRLPRDLSRFGAGAARSSLWQASASRLGRTELVIASVILATYACGILRLLFNESGPGAAAYRAITLTGYLVTLALLYPHRRAAWQLLCRSPLLALFCVLPVISTLWSTSVGDTLVRSITLLGSSAMALYLVLRFPDRQLLRLVCVIATGVAILSVVLIAAVPSIGTHPDAPWTGTWRGAYNHKNELGPAMGLNAAWLALYCIEHGRQTNRWAVIGLVLCFALVIAAKSITGLIVLMMGISVLLVIRVLGQRIKNALAPAILLLMQIAAAVVFFVFSTGLAELVGGLGRDITFSGRVPIWTAIWPFVEKNFWLGYGYEAFWVKSQIGVRIIEETLHFRPFYAHNGIVELFLSLGVMGVVIFSALFVVFLWRLVRLVARSPESTLGNMAALFTLSFVTANFSEVLIFARNEATWCLFLAFYLKLAAPDAPSLGITAQTRRRPGTSGRW